MGHTFHLIGGGSNSQSSYCRSSFQEPVECVMVYMLMTYVYAVNIKCISRLKVPLNVSWNRRVEIGTLNGKDKWEGELEWDSGGFIICM